MTAETTVEFAGTVEEPVTTTAVDELIAAGEETLPVSVAVIGQIVVEIAIVAVTTTVLPELTEVD